ncbi:uncharacterized protein LOC134765050 [Penaeus indicus]|uniref:uncharacterized protein LOC134765050 n=1 Tax=Penaeus indicus TaxID=29960 RepID=UPI00300D23E2
MARLRSCFFLAPWTKRRGSRMVLFLASFFLGLCILKALHPAPDERMSFARARLRQVLDSLEDEALLQDEGGEVEDEGKGAEGEGDRRQEDEEADEADQKRNEGGFEGDEWDQEQDGADKEEEEGGRKDKRLQEEDEGYQEEDEEDRGEVEGYQEDEGDQDEERGDEDVNEGRGKTGEGDFEREDRRYLPLGKAGFPEEESYRDIKLDFKRSSRRLWPDDGDEFCSRMDVRFAVRMSSSILHSFPRSGNTWMRYLIEAASGIFTGSCYNDKTLIRSGFKGERDKIYWKTTITTKAHFAKHVGKFKYLPTIIIIRNPAR